MKYIVYLTINKINGKIYIGVHKTEDPNKFDGYLGMGAEINKPSSYNKGKSLLHRAILKYGISSFRRITLKAFDKLDDALDLEAWLVTPEFVKRIDTYNMTPGGGMPPLMTKKIYEFNTNGELIKEWNSIKEITQAFGCNKDRITMCIKDKRSFNNSYWSENNTINVSEYRLSSRGFVYQYNKDGLLLNVFKDASDAASKLDINRNSIVSSVFNRTMCCGCYFLKGDENIELLLNEKSSKKDLKLTPVYRYLTTGEFDKEYTSMKLASLDIKKTYSTIIRAIKNNRTCGGYKWSYEKTDMYKSFNGKQLNPVKIAQFNLNHELIKIWDSVSECKKEFPSCQKVCRKQRKSTKGFIFEYIS